MNHKQCLKLYREGEEMAFKGNYEEAIRLLTKVLNAYPNFHPAYWNRSGCYHAIGNKTHEAICDLKRYFEIVEDKKDKALALAYIGAFYVSQKNMDSNDQAIEYFEKAIDLDPECHIAYVNRGSAYIARIAASNEFRSIKNDNTAEAVTPIGTDTFEAALRDFIKAYELSPKDTFALAHMNYIFTSYWDDQAVIDLCGKLIKEFPSNASLYYFLGVGHNKKDEFNLALEDLTKSIELNSDSSTANNWRGITYCNLGKREEAIRDFTRAIELQPKLPFLYANRSIAYCYIKEIEQAIVDLKKAVSLQEKGYLKDELNKRLMVIQHPDCEIDLKGKMIDISAPILSGQDEPFTVNAMFAVALHYF